MVKSTQEHHEDTEYLQPWRRAQLPNPMSRWPPAAEHASCRTWSLYGVHLLWGLNGTIHVKYVSQASVKYIAAAAGMLQQFLRNSAKWSWIQLRILVLPQSHYFVFNWSLAAIFPWPHPAVGLSLVPTFGIVLGHSRQALPREDLALENFQYKEHASLRKKNIL